MNHIAERHDRFMQDPPGIRLGGIAANLARIASFACNTLNRQAVFDLIDESKWFIEWVAPSVEPEVAARLAEMQVSLAVIEARMRAGDVDVPALIQSASAWSGEVLEMSGLAR